MSEAEPSAKTPEVLQPLPDSWPGGFGLYKYAREATRVNLGTIVILLVLSGVVSIGANLAVKGPGDFIGGVVGCLTSAGVALASLAGVRRKKMSFSQAVNEAFPLWLKMIGLSLLLILSYALSFLALIVPFFFVYPRLKLAVYYLVDKNMGVIEAYKASWNQTKGNVGKVYDIIGASIAMALLLFTIIGIPVAIYLLIMYSTATAILYELLNKHKAADS